MVEHWPESDVSDVNIFCPVELIKDWVGDSIPVFYKNLSNVCTWRLISSLRFVSRVVRVLYSISVWEA